MNWKVTDGEKEQQGYGSKMIAADCKQKPELMLFVCKAIIAAEGNHEITKSIAETIRRKNGYEVSDKQLNVLINWLAWHGNGATFKLCYLEMMRLRERTEAQILSERYDNDPVKLAAKVIELEQQVRQLSEVNGSRQRKASGYNEKFFR